MKKWVSMMVSFILFFTSLKVFASEWAVTYGGLVGELEIVPIQQTTDAGYITARWIYSSDTSSIDAWILKLDSNGKKKWEKVYDNMGQNEEIKFVRQINDGYIVIGTVSDNLDINRNIFVLKLDLEGNIIWQKIYDITSKDNVYFIQQTTDQGYIVVGTINSSNNTDILVLKLDSNGDIEWQKAYGGDENDGAYCIKQTSDGGYIVAGWTSSFSIGVGDIWILKLDSDGDIEWQKTYGGEGNDWATWIEEDSEGGYIVSGTISSSESEEDMWILKLDSDGSIEWQKAYGGDKDDGAYCIKQTRDDGYIVAGWTSSFGLGKEDMWILKLDSNGDIEWQKTYGGNDRDIAYRIDQTSDEGFIVSGITNSFGGFNDIWILKLNSKGEIPDCPIGITSNASPRITSILPQDSNISPSLIDVFLSNGSFTVKDYSVTSTEVCPSLVESTDHNNNSGGGGGGCSINSKASFFIDLFLLMGFVFVLLLKVRKKNLSSF